MQHVLNSLLYARECTHLNFHLGSFWALDTHFPPPPPPQLFGADMTSAEALDLCRARWQSELISFLCLLTSCQRKGELFSLLPTRGWSKGYGKIFSILSQLRHHAPTSTGHEQKPRSWWWGLRLNFSTHMYYNKLPRPTTVQPKNNPAKKNPWGLEGFMFQRSSQGSGPPNPTHLH